MLTGRRPADAPARYDGSSGPGVKFCGKVWHRVRAELIKIVVDLPKTIA